MLLGFVVLIAIFTMSYFWTKFLFSEDGPDWENAFFLLGIVLGILGVLLIIGVFV